MQKSNLQKTKMQKKIRNQVLSALEEGYKVNCFGFYVPFN